MPIDGPIDSFNVSPDGVIKVEKSDISPNELTITGLAGGERHADGQERRPHAAL